MTRPRPALAGSLETVKTPGDRNRGAVLCSVLRGGGSDLMARVSSKGQINSPSEEDGRVQWLLVGISALSSRMICLDFMVLRSENWPALRASEEVLAATIYGEAMYSMVPITSMTAQSQASWAWVMTHDASVAAM